MKKRVYKVKTPSGVFADGQWEEPSKIPAKLPDRREHYFETAEADIVMVEVEVESPTTAETIES